MTDLSSTSNEMTIEIGRNFAFYLNSTLLNIEEFKTIRKEYSFDELENKIIFINNDLILELATKLDNSSLLLKKNKLQGNCFKIIELKEKLKRESYKYITEKYLQLIKSYCDITKILVECFDESFLETEGNQKIFFNYQYQIFNDHLKEIQKIMEIDFEDPTIRLQPTKHEKKVTIQKSNVPNEIKPFRDFIKHEKNEEIEKLVKQHFSDYRGVPLRYLIQFFEDNNLIILNYKDKQQIYNSIKELFDNKDIATYGGVFNIKNYSTQNLKYRDLKKSFETFFKDFIIRT